MSQKKIRYIMPDLFKGMACLLMFIVHWEVDQSIFLKTEPHLPEYGLGLLTDTVGFLFVFFSGVSTQLEYNLRGPRLSAQARKRRFMQLLGIGILISVTSLIFFSDYVVWFGVIHLIAISYILSGWILGKKIGTLMAVLISFAFWMILKQIDLDSILLIPFGKYPAHMGSGDWFPLFPWFGIFALGLGAAQMSYFERVDQRIKEVFSKKILIWFTSFIEMLGRHSLILYLIHQPLFLILIKGIKT